LKTFFHNYWKTLTWAILIALLLFTSGENLPKQKILKIDHLDKLIHFALFLIHGLLILLEYSIRNKGYSLARKISIVLVILLYAAFTELIQAFFIQKRDGAWCDFAADALGIMTGIVLYTLLKKKITILS